MQRHRPIHVFALLLMLSGTCLCSQLFAQNIQQINRAKPLANGVLKRIPMDLNPRDMVSIPRPLPDLKVEQYQPKTISNKETLYGQSRSVILFRENVWQYDFSFTGLRQAKLKLPQSDGRLVEKNCWYMVYQIRDTGKTMTFEQVKQSPEFEHLTNDLRRDQPIAPEKKKLLPRFTLEGWVVRGETRDRETEKYEKVAYRDVMDAAVLAQIQLREDANQQLLDTHQMSKAKIPLAKNENDPGVWGAAIWTDVDPRIDYVSVYVNGLTNAFRLAPDLKSPSKLKTLQLNFWRPGDHVSQQRDSVDFGIPLVDDPVKQALICKRYDLPGPVIRGYHVNPKAKRNVLVLETDAEVNLENFQSTITPTLDQGKLPAQIADAFAAAGFNVNKSAALTTITQGKRWTFKEGDVEFVLAMEPQFWESDFGGIRFIKSLDHIWIYR